MKCPVCNNEVTIEKLESDSYELYFCEQCGYNSQSNFKKDEDMLVNKINSTSEFILNNIKFDETTELYWFPFLLKTSEMACVLDLDENNNKIWKIIMPDSKGWIKTVIFKLTEFHKCRDFIKDYFKRNKW